MNRYMIVIPAKNRSFVLKCDEGDGAKLETLQKLVSGYVETVPSALDATWAREKADRLVLLVDEDGRLKCKAANQKATQLAPADVTANGKLPIVGAAVLMFQRGDELLGFTKYVADTMPKATEPLTEGVTPNAQALTVTPMTATVKQYGGWAAITDVLQLTAIDNNITQATKVLASQAGRTLDTVTREVLAGGTNVIYAPAGDTAVTSRANLTTASVLTPDLIDQAATALKAQNADAIGESYVAIVHPYVAYDLRRNPEWIDVHKYSTPENIYNGEIGKLAGVRFIETSEAKIWTGTGCPSGLAVFGTLVLAAHAYAVTEVEGGGLQHIVKQLGAGEDPLNQRASVGWKAIKTAERLCEQYMVRIESVSPKYSAKAKAN